MTAVGKAQKLASICKEHGWTGSLEINHDDDYAKLSVTRDNERLEIEWLSNQLMAPPKYSYNGMESRLHCASVARRTVERSPEIARRQESQVKRRSSAKRSSSLPSPTSSALALPFRIGETPDREILRICRDRTVVWKGQYSETEEMAHIPKLKNTDLENVYYIGESSAGRPYLSFIDHHGCFRAVAFDSMLYLH